MTTPLCKETIIGAVAILLLTSLAVPFNPLVALSFQSGVVVGLLLHSTHIKSSKEKGWIESHPP